MHVNVYKEVSRQLTRTALPLCCITNIPYEEKAFIYDTVSVYRTLKVCYDGVLSNELRSEEGYE